MKSEGAGNRERMLKLSMMASKFGYFLLAAIAIPMMWEMSSILKFWLTDVPTYTVAFCNLIIITLLTNQLTVGLQSGIQAIGDIKIYQVVVGGVQLLNLPIAYFLLFIGLPPFSGLISYVFIEFIACMLRMFYLSKKASMSISEYCSTVFIKEIIPTLNVIIISFLIVTFINFQYRFILTVGLGSFVFMISVYIWGMEVYERKYVHNIMNKISFIRKTKFFEIIN